MMYNRLTALNSSMMSMEEQRLMFGVLLTALHGNTLNGTIDTTNLNVLPPPPTSSLKEKKTRLVVQYCF